MQQRLTILTGASRGMGLAMAEQLLQPGALLLCISRKSNASLDALAAQRGATLEQWQADLADAAPVAARLSAWLQAQDPAALQSATLINNAGVLSALAPLRDGQSADLANALRVGLEAPLLLCAAFLGATRNWTAPRKVLNFSRSLAMEEALQAHGAKVCALAPGVIATDMQVQLRSADPQSFPDLANFQALHERGMLSSPADAAARILAFLAQPDFGAEPVADVRG